MTARARRQPLVVPPVPEVSDDQLRDEFWDLAWKTWNALDAAIEKAPPAPTEEWAPLAPVPDLPLVMESWNDAAQAVRRPLLTAGPPLLTEGDAP